jgi:hypothetical protein
MAFQAGIDNRTPYPVESYVLPDKDGQENLLVVVAATFRADERNVLTLAEEPSTIRGADVHYAEPGLSSVKYEADVALEKPLVDVLVNGQAYAPHGRQASQVPVGIVVGDVRKVLLVHGDREWRFSRDPSRAEPFTTMPIVYERAFGGTDVESKSCDPRNPIGVGFRGVPPLDAAIRTEVPNVEYPNALVNRRGDTAPPAGFGVVGRGWQPRVRLAGTFDDRWLKEQWPLLPLDFDVRHYQAAPADQQSATLRGGEQARLVNLTPDGEWTFRLPVLDVPAHLFYDDRRLQVPLRLDTVLIEPDLRRITLTARVHVVTIRNRGLLRQIVVGHMTPGQIRARGARKRYVGRDDSAGAPSGEPPYHL